VKCGGLAEGYCEAWWRAWEKRGAPPASVHLVHASVPGAVSGGLVVDGICTRRGAARSVSRRRCERRVSARSSSAKPDRELRPEVVAAARVSRVTGSPQVTEVAHYLDTHGDEPCGKRRCSGSRTRGRENLAAAMPRSRTIVWCAAQRARVAAAGDVARPTFWYAAGAGKRRRGIARAEAIGSSAPRKRWKSWRNSRSRWESRFARRSCAPRHRKLARLDRVEAKALLELLHEIRSPP